MFEQLSSAPLLSTPGDALADALLRPVASPAPDAVWSLVPRTVQVATRDGGWRAARVLAWTWNPTGAPVLWRCAVDLGGEVGWYAYDARLLRPAAPARPGAERAVIDRADTGSNAPRHLAPAGRPESGERRP